MKRVLLTAVGAFVGGFGTLVFLVSLGNDDTPPHVLAIAACGAVLGAAVPRLAVAKKKEQGEDKNENVD